MNELEERCGDEGWCPEPHRAARVGDVCTRFHLTEAGKELVSFIREYLTPDARGGWEE